METELRFIPNAFKHGVTEDEIFKNDDEIIGFMEAHDGFELADQGFAEIIETPVFSRKDKVEFQKPRRGRIIIEIRKLYNEQNSEGVALL